MDTENTFEERKNKYILEERILSRKYNLYSTLRVTLFVAMLVAVIYFANAGVVMGAVITLAAFILIFGLLVNKHSQITHALTNSRNHIKINEQELLRIAGSFQTLEGGEEYLIEKHPYAKDMDIFGRNSLFQLINRSNTPTGKDKLAGWLSEKAEKEQIWERQQAIKELTPVIDWRQEYQSAGMFHKEQHKGFRAVLNWINESAALKISGFTRVLAYVLPLVMITLIILNFALGLSIYYTIGLAFINGIFLRKYTAKVTEITESTGKGLETLKAYGDLIAIIENTVFSSQLLVRLQRAFSHDGAKASDSILKLQRILRFLYGRSNMFYWFLNVILLFDIHLLLMAENWKKRQQADVNRWFENIGEFEALNSLAGFAFANNDFTYPGIAEEAFYFEAKSLGHPLIHRRERINNDLSLQGEGSIVLITGSNMSGKSTFLRTVGINMVLAYAGAPVCAAQLRLSLFQLFTSMRTEDNLEEHISSFYAELQRIKLLLEMVKKEEEPIMFMLDEILKGTNSNDRHAGAEALIRQLAQHKVIGFVSTHDLVLGELANELERVENYSFNSRIEGDRIIFDYKMEKGLCYSFNASKLMEQIGIDLNLKK